MSTDTSAPHPDAHAPKPVVLCILDGWGYRAERDNNAIALGPTPFWDRLVAERPHALLATSGLAVGLPVGQMGNSEVGHMNLGGGRVVKQSLPRIDDAIADGSFDGIATLGTFRAALKASGGTAHLMGLMSPGGVHSHQDHMVALVKSLCADGIPVAVHAFMDGRDTAPSSGAGFLADFEAAIAGCTGAFIATVTGRYYAMDRDNRWDRVSLAHDAMRRGEGHQAATGAAAVSLAYETGKTDEFIPATVIGGYAGMTDGDGLIMANFRADRAREILSAFVDPAFDGFERGTRVAFAALAGMVEYSSALNAYLPTMFPALQVRDSLGEVVARAGRRQLRIAETEKYAHVTFFFNGGEETIFPGEERILVPSPDVATYDLQPEMSAAELTDKLVAAIESGAHDLIVVNYANGDMVGHTGILEAAMQAAAAIDASLTRLVGAVEAAGGAMLVTADHGNCEMMVDPETGGAHTAHTLGDVPLILVDTAASGRGIASGRLADVAPTLLDLMRLEAPAAMTGRSLLRRGGAAIEEDPLVATA